MVNKLFTTPVTDVDDRRSIFAACMMSGAGTICFLLFPMIIGGAMDTLELDSELGGYLFAVYMAGFTLINLAAVTWVRRLDWKLQAGVSYLLLAVSFATSGLVGSYTLLLVSLFLAGVSAGMLYGLSMCMIGDCSDPDRFFGAKLLAEAAVGAILLWTLPATTMALWGFSGLGFGMAAMVIVLMLSTKWVPSAGRPHSQGTPAAGDGMLSALRWFLPFSVGLLALFLFFFGANLVWAFAERIADDQQLDTVAIGRVLSYAVIAGGLGALCSALLGDRLGRGLPLLIATIVMCSLYHFLNGSFGLTAFFIYAITIVFMNNMSLAYQFGLVASADPEGRYAVLMPALMAIGGVLSGGIGGTLIERAGNYSLLLYSAMAILVVATALFLWLVWHLKGTASDAADVRAVTLSGS